MGKGEQGYLCFLCIIIFLFLNACKKETDRNNYKPRFVVEGWIEQDDYPYVILTHNLPFFTSVDSAQLAEVVIRHAKVTVTDGVETEILTGKRDDRYFPYFVYRGTSLKGKVGHTYRLTIEYAGNTLAAETSIPTLSNLDSIWFMPKSGNMLQLNVRMKDDPIEKNYYKLYTKLEKDKRFIPTLLSNQDDKYFSGKSLTLQINRGPLNNLTSKYDSYFTYGDTVMVKLATLPKSGFDFWSSFQDEIINASNPLIGSTHPLKSNITGPGVGVWSGYGVKIYQAVARP